MPDNDLFADGTVLQRPELDGTRGPTTDAAQHWKDYPTACREITHAGASLLTFGDDDPATRSSTYTAAQVKRAS